MSRFIISIFIAIFTAILETVGAFGSGLIWQDERKRVFAIFLILIGFGGASLAYVIMRKFIPDLAIAQAVFISGTALFAAVATIFINKNINWEMVVGIILVTIGAILINRVSAV